MHPASPFCAVSAGFLLGQISDLGDKLTSIVTYHVLPQPLTPEQAGVEGAPVAFRICQLGTWASGRRLHAACVR